MVKMIFLKFLRDILVTFLIVNGSSAKSTRKDSYLMALDKTRLEKNRREDTNVFPVYGAPVSSSYGPPTTETSYKPPAVPHSTYESVAPESFTPAESYSPPSSSFAPSYSPSYSPAISHSGYHYSSPSHSYETPYSSYHPHIHYKPYPPPVYGPPPTEMMTTMMPTNGEPHKNGDMWLWEKITQKIIKKIDLFSMTRIFLKIIIFKKIVKFIALICLLFFIPSLKDKDHGSGEDERNFGQFRLDKNGRYQINSMYFGSV